MTPEQWADVANDIPAYWPNANLPPVTLAKWGQALSAFSARRVHDGIAEAAKREQYPSLAAIVGAVRERAVADAAQSRVRTAPMLADVNALTGAVGAERAATILDGLRRIGSMPDEADERESG